MKKFFKWLGIIIGVLIIIPIAISIFAIASGDYESVEVELTEFQKDSVSIVELEAQVKHLEEYTWTANNFIRQYGENEIKADEMFKGKYNTIYGTVLDMGKDIMDRPYLMIGEYNYSSLQCVFSKEDINKLANLNKGNKVLLKGKCTGKLGHIVFENCRLLKNKKELLHELNILKTKEYPSVK